MADLDIAVRILLAAGAALLLLWLLWVAAVSFHYRVRSAPPQLLRARADDGWALAVHHRPGAPRRFREPVLLCHGLAANRYTFDFDPPYSLAHALSAAGFECFTVEWRGTGKSSWPPPGHRWWDYSVDDHIQRDAPAALRLALERSGADRAFWVGHSLGGLIGYAFAEAGGGAHLAGLAALGSPVSFESDPILRRAIRIGSAAAWPFGLRERLMSLTLAPFLGRLALPLTDVVVNPEHIAPGVLRKVDARVISSMGRGVLLQLRDWVENDAFRSRDGKVDYRTELRRVRVPLLVMGGSRDRLAPPSALRMQHDLAGSEEKTLVIFGRDRGDRFDYGHGDLLYGTGAPLEIHPLLSRWLSEHATPLCSS